MSATLALYRFLTGGVGTAAVPLGSLFAPAGSAWRDRLGFPAVAERTAGGPWIHAASLGEAAAALRWAESLLASGYRAPLLVTTRTATGLSRVRREGGVNLAAAFAPIDFPQAVRRVLRDAAPMRLDLIETELWPNLLVEAHRAVVPVVAVSATVSARTAGRLRSLGLTGDAIFGPLHVLAQSERHAERFLSLGVAPDRCRVIGDLKADRRVEGAASLPDADSRRLVLFTSLRPGEEEAAVAVTSMLAARGDRGAWRFIVAPRHDRGLSSLRSAFSRAGVRFDERNESTRATASVLDWARGSGPSGSAIVGVLATRGELPELMPCARLALVGGTFAPWGGHNVLEPAASGCPVVVGPHHEEVEAGVALLLAHSAGAVAANGAEAAAIVSRWLDESPSVRAAAALQAARAAEGAAGRGIEALMDWGLGP